MRVFAQVNTPSGATMPFGQMIQTNPAPYAAGILPTNLPAGAYTPGSNLYGKSQDAYNAYNTWKSNYVVNCGGSPTQYRVLFDDGSSTVSEGIGYGMLLAAYAADKTLFDGLWAYYKANSDGNGLMNWKMSGCTGVSGSNAASDADEDAAMALSVAACQWPTATSPYTYKTEATNLITAINKCEIDTKTSPAYQMSNGDGWITCNTVSNTCRNPSYMAPAYYKYFATYVPSLSTQWTNTVNASYTLINANRNSTTGLVSDWCDQNGVTNSCNGSSPGTYGYDASRHPWRMAVDVAWNNDANASAQCAKIASYVNGVGAASIAGPVAQTGGTGTTHNATFVSTFAAGIVGSSATYQALMNSMYTQTVNTTDALPAYFGNTLRVISLFLQTGNFWKPCGPFTTCQAVNLGPDQTTCGGGFPVLLNSGATTNTNVTFTWKIISPTSSTLVNASSTAKTYSVTAGNGAGTYVVIRDSSSGTCTSTDTIVISSTLPVPSLGSNQVICNPSSYNLSPSNAASFPAGTTWQWQLNGSNISGATSSTYNNARTAGTYKLSASIAGCATTSSTVVLTSNLPTPVDGCSSSLPIALSVVGSSTYQWYSTSTSTTVLASGNTYNAPAAGTYYVQDMSATTGSVGPTTFLSGAMTYGSSTSLVAFNVSQNFSITSMQVPLGFYSIPSGGANFTVTVTILNSTGGALSPAQSFTSNATTIPNGSATGLYTFTFTGLNIQSSWGANLTMSVTNLTGTGGASGYIAWFMGSSYSYPYNSTPSGVVSITGAYDSNYGGATSTEYGSALNWQIQTGTPCNRLPVIATTSSCTLPLDWVSVQAQRISNNKAIVTWTTAKEQNNAYFILQRSEDGLVYQNVGTLNANASNSGLTNYSLTDNTAPLSMLYYRVVQFDLDGKSSSSQIVVVSGASVSGLLAVPNPFSNNTKIVFQDVEIITTELTVTNLQGNIVQQLQVSSNNDIYVGENLASGIYFVSAWDGTSYKTIKIIKQ